MSIFALDKSGNSNHWTANNLVTSDVTLDSPTNNFCTNDSFVEKFHSSYPTVIHSEGNLKVELTSAGGGYCGSKSQWAIPSTGKWYVESCILTTGNGYGYPHQCLSRTNGHPIQPYNTTVQNYNYGSTQSSVGDIYGMGYDADTETVYWYKNGSQVNSESLISSLSGEDIYFMFREDNNSGDKKMPFIVNYGQDSSFAGAKTAQGNTDSEGYGDFYYSVPSGFKSLCTSNLPDPAVIPSEHFNVGLWTGNSSSQTAVNDWGFQADFLWTKVRSAVDHHIFRDTVRDNSATMDLSLRSNSTAVEYGSNGHLTVNSSGFSVSGHDGDEMNYNNSTYVTWGWKGGGVGGSSNTNGSITSTVSANQDAGFSIVGYTGSGATGTVGHGLSSTPDLIHLKARNSANREWFSFVQTDDDKYFRLNSTMALSSSDVIDFGSTTITLIGDDPALNGSSIDYIMYCFHSVEGFSKCGKYVGNGESSDGTYVHLGFTPKWVLIKSSSFADIWGIYDNERSTYNVVDDFLRADTSGAEQTNDTNVKLDFLSNGFKVRGNNDAVNKSGGTLIYLAFAETPFKHSNAR